MAAKKSQASRLGSDPFGWIRDTREAEEEARETAEQTPPAPEPAKQEAQPPQSTAGQQAQTPPQPVAPPAEGAKEAPKPAPARAAQQRQAPAQAKPPEEAPQVAPAPAPEAAAQGDPGLQEAIAEAKAALSAQELKALALLLEQAKGPGKRGRPRTNFREVTKSSQEGLPENWTRATFIVRETHLETLKDYAYTQRMTIRDALDQALEQYLEDKQTIARRVRGED